MLMSERFVMRLVSGVILVGFLSLAVFAAPPEGKGKPGGGGDDPPPLPVDLDVRYRVHYVPVPENIYSSSIKDVNDVYESVGSWSASIGELTGFYYDAATRTFLNATDMFTLPPGWVSTNFTSINNFGTIVGFATDVNGIKKGFIVYPVEGGFDFEFLPSPAGDADGYKAWSINDFEDIVGHYWRDNGDGTQYEDAFAYNSGRLNAVDYLPMTPFGLGDHRNAVTEVTNARLGFAGADSGDYWFDFGAAQTLYDEDPGNDIEPVSPVLLPTGWEVEVPSGTWVAISNGGHLGVSEQVLVKKKGNRFIYAYTPGVLLDDQFLWQGAFNEGRTQAVNSASDILGKESNTTSAWIYHADHPDWGLLDVRSMLVFDSADDEDRWDSTSTGGGTMSDRDPATGFGVIIGHTSDSPFVLMPEIVNP